MKKTLLAVLCVAALPHMAAAQVEKQVEVTKAYVPSVESAAKLPVAPDRTDTVKLRPEIDYTITPLSLSTTLSTRPIRPASVTYWQFNRPLPCYLKVGAGYPFNSVLDFYASSQNPSTGYVVGYVNHEGHYADLRNDFGVKNNSLSMSNRAGAAAGKYLGKHILEGEVYYDHRIVHRYGLYTPPGSFSYSESGGRVLYGDAGAGVRIGDDFQDLSRLNFEVALHADLFSGRPDAFELPADDAAGTNALKVETRMRQLSWGASARVARAWGRSRLSVGVGYTHMAGGKDLDGERQQTIRAGVRYGFDGGVVRLEAGADFYHDRMEQQAVPEQLVERGNYLLPFLKMDFNLGTVGLKPFVEIDGSVTPNDYRSLAQRNPYLADCLWMDRSSVDYNGRFGVGGSLWRSRFTYRIYAGFSIRDNHLYWYSWNDLNGEVDPESRVSGLSQALTGRQTVTSINGEAEWRPVSELRISVAMHGYLYNDEARFSDPEIGTLKPKNGAPAFEGNVSLRYEGRKVAFGVQALLQSERTWTAGASWFYHSQAPGAVSEARLLTGRFTAPFAVDIRATFEWKLSRRATLFAEGRNLADRRLYRYAWFPEYGAGFTAGVKVVF